MNSPESSFFPLVVYSHQKTAERTACQKFINFLMSSVLVRGAEHLSEVEISRLFVRIGKVLHVQKLENGGVKVELETENQCNMAISTLHQACIEQDRWIAVEKYYENSSRNMDRFREQDKQYPISKDRDRKGNICVFLFDFDGVKFFCGHPSCIGDGRKKNDLSFKKMFLLIRMIQITTKWQYRIQMFQLQQAGSYGKKLQRVKKIVLQQKKRKALRKHSCVCKSFLKPTTKKKKTQKSKCCRTKSPQERRQRRQQK